MASRVQVQSGLGRVRLTPAASPVDSYARPADGQQLAQLAEALGQVAPEVLAFGNLVDKRKGEREQAAGQQAARDYFESGKSYREAIASGAITADKSPWFKQGAEEQFGKLAANNFNSDLKVAFAQSEASDSYEPKDFDKFAADFMKTWGAENLPDDRTQAFNTGFANVDSYIAGQRDQFANRAGENLIKYNRDNFGAAVFSDLRRIAETHGTAEDMVTSVQNSLDLQVAAGLSPKVANDIAAEAIIRMAEVTEKPAFLDLLKSIKAGPASLYDRPSVGQAVLQAEKDIYDRRMQRESAETQARRESNRIATNTVMQGAIGAVNANPANANLDPFIAQLRNLDNPESTVASLVNLKRTMAGEKFAGDQGVASELLGYAATVMDETDPNYVSRLTIANALNARRINQQDFNNVLSIIDQREREDNGAAAKTLRDPLFTQFNSLLKQQFGNELTMTGERRLGMFRASTELTNEWLQWRNGEGASASDPQKLEKLTKLVELKRVKFGGMFTDMRNQLTKAIPEVDLGKPAPKPAWQTAAVPSVTRQDWLDISAAYVRGGGSIDSLSNDQIQKLSQAGATPTTLSAFIEAQLGFQGIQPAAAKR